MGRVRSTSALVPGCRAGAGNKLPVGLGWEPCAIVRYTQTVLGARYRDYSFPSFAKGRHRRGRS